MSGYPGPPPVNSGRKTITDNTAANGGPVSAGVDLATRYALMRRRYQELEKKCDIVTKEAKELRAFIMEILDQQGNKAARANMAAGASPKTVLNSSYEAKSASSPAAASDGASAKRNFGVQCDLMRFLGQHNLENYIAHMEAASMLTEGTNASSGAGKISAEKDSSNAKTTSKAEAGTTIGNDLVASSGSVGLQDTFFKILISIVQESKRLLKIFSTPDSSLSSSDQKPSETKNALEFSTYLQHRRKSPDYIFDTCCIRGGYEFFSSPSSDFKANEEKRNSQVRRQENAPEYHVGHLFIFKEHIEFITPFGGLSQMEKVEKSDSAPSSPKEWKVWLLELDEIVSVENRSPFPSDLKFINQNTVFYNINELQQRSSQPISHSFWDVGESSLESCIVTLKEQLSLHYTQKIPEFEKIDPKIEKISIFENERKTITWSGRFLLPGDPANFSDSKGRSHSGPEKGSKPPTGYDWVSEDWTIDSDDYIARVLETFPGSPATFSGLHMDDLVVNYHAFNAPFQPQPSFTSFSKALKAVNGSSLELIIYRRSSHSFINIYLRPFQWSGKGFGIRFERLDGWTYSKSFQGPWVEVGGWTDIARRRKWSRFAKRLDDAKAEDLLLDYTPETRSLEPSPEKSGTSTAQSTATTTAPPSANSSEASTFSSFMDPVKYVGAAGASLGAGIFGGFSKGVEALGGYRRKSNKSTAESIAERGNSASSQSPTKQGSSLSLLPIPNSSIVVESKDSHTDAIIDDLFGPFQTASSAEREALSDAAFQGPLNSLTEVDKISTDEASDSDEKKDVEQS